MGWGITYNAYLNKVTKSELDSVITESDESIRHCKDKIILWCGMKLDGDANEFLSEFNETWEWLLESVITNAKAIECKEDEESEEY